MTKILLITPPFTQLNTAYPATAYLKGFLNTRNIACRQADLSLEVALELFSSMGLSRIFKQMEDSDAEVSDNAYHIFKLRDAYLKTIDPVVAFLQHKNPTLAHAICSRNYLPEASRFSAATDLEWAFGTLGTQDKARHLATLYLEDLGDLITEVIDPHFGFSRYAERLGRTASSFDDLEAALQQPDTLAVEMLLNRLDAHINDFKPTLVGITIPFPGNLFAGLKCGQYIKNKFPHIKIVLGGGYANTELRSLRDERIFDYIDFISLDDGEAPLLFLIEHLEGIRPIEGLKRIFFKKNGLVQYINSAIEKDVAQREIGVPDYSDLLLDRYLSVIEIANPMHRLWSDGRWNKMTLAHGCYWGKCTFCDITLDYIQRYEPLNAGELCDRIEAIIQQTGQNGFHFVDEAAPPALMRDLALEILRRQLTVVWWTNIRFEKTFTPDLCRLLRASGCIAVTGGLEVASDRLLLLIKKGVTVAQVAQVADAFSQTGILVHAYLMYGFPTQTEQETIDSLEMVRQMFEISILQSAYWHQFAMTAHSPVGLNPEEFQVKATGPVFKGFADNDRFHEDPTGGDHERFSEGLKISLYNYMNSAGLDWPLHRWFKFIVPKTSISPNYIRQAIADVSERAPKDTSLVIWLGPLPEVHSLDEDLVALVFYDQKESWTIETEASTGVWLAGVLPLLSPFTGQGLNWRAFRESWPGDFGIFSSSELWNILIEKGLLIV